jgi:hypothetical protein
MDRHPISVVATRLQLGDVPHPLEQWLDRFPLDALLREHVAHVLSALPDPVRMDFLDDPAFTLFDYEPGLQGMHVPVGLPTKKSPSRSVVLKRTLRRRPISFVRYIIAHELAHAHLRNAGRSPGEDPEHAADALAADWGFPRPPHHEIVAMWK